MNGSQLKLFSEPIATSYPYKPGDWVKLKRKPKTNGISLKRNDTVKITEVHPIDGSIKFWNDFCNCWDYLYPEDFKPTVCPTTSATIPLTVEPVVGQIETALTVEPVVGQSETALTVEPVVGQIDKAYGCNGWLESHYKIRREGKQHSINCPEPGCTGPYNMYRWREGKRQRAKYCPANKSPAVRRALRNGEPVSEILKIINKS